MASADLAQLVAHRTCNTGVTGSSPVVGSTHEGPHPLGNTGDAGLRRRTARGRGVDASPSLTAGWAHDSRRLPGAGFDRREGHHAVRFLLRRHTAARAGEHRPERRHRRGRPFLRVREGHHTPRLRDPDSRVDALDGRHLVRRRPRCDRRGVAGAELVRYQGFDQDERGIGPRAGGGRIAWVEDPDGNTLALETED